jgi:hypothetical protein
MPSRFFRRPWDESRGDDFDGWGHSVWYFEVGEDGWLIRQIEAYDSGPVLRYGPGHEEDEYGCLGQASLDDSEGDWSRYTIAPDSFEHVWDSVGE